MASANSQPGPSKPQAGKTGRCDENVTPDFEKAKYLEQNCCKGITVPPMLPPILKEFTKSAIRTQPKDLTRWAYSYFRALELGEIPPVKDKLEFPVIEAPNGLSKGFFRVLNKQLGNQSSVPLALLTQKWEDICLDGCKLVEFLESESISTKEDIEWDRFLISSAACLSNQDTILTMELLCSTLTPDIDAPEARIPFQRWWELYVLQAVRKGIDQAKVNTLLEYLTAKTGKNNGTIGPSDFKDDPNCPPLI